MEYKPEPIDTSCEKLPKGLRNPHRRVGRTNHDLWARQRLSEGWTYGPNRDDENKTHPDLLPYADLSDSEKEYDRITAMEGLKAIMALGYEITPFFSKTQQNKGYLHRAIKEMVGPT